VTSQEKKQTFSRANIDLCGKKGKSREKKIPIFLQNLDSRTLLVGGAIDRRKAEASELM